jgi:hypothetical protein
MPYKSTEIGRLRQRERNRLLRQDPLFRAKERERFNERRRERRQTDSEFCRTEAARMRKNRSGWTREVFEQAWALQSGGCAICHVPLDVIGHGATAVAADHDHDHVTGTLRGLLCNHCNRGLGLFRDSIEVLLSAAIYLESYS